MTKEDLLQIGELLEPINKRLDGIEKNMVTKSDLEANNRILGTIFKVELASTRQEIATAMKAGFQETVKQIKRVEQKLDHIAEDHEARITRLEEAADLTHRN